MHTQSATTPAKNAQHHTVTQLRRTHTAACQLQLPRLQPPLYTARCTDTRRRRCDTRPTLAVPLPSCLAAARHCKQPDWSATPLANVLKRPGPTPHPRDKPCRTHRRLAHPGRRVCALCWSHSSLFQLARLKGQTHCSSRAACRAHLGTHDGSVDGHTREHTVPASFLRRCKVAVKLVKRLDDFSCPFHCALPGSRCV